MEKGACDVCPNQAIINNMQNNIATLNAIVTGDKTPETGLVTKVSTLTNWMTQVRWVIGIFVISLLSVIVTSVKTYNMQDDVQAVNIQLERMTTILEHLSKKHDQ